MTRRIYFDHIPKTGGTSFHNVLTSWFGKNQVSPPIAGQRFGDVMAQYRHLDAISGHVHYGPGDELSADHVNVTIVRDPIDRALSQYFFNKETRVNLHREDHRLFESPLLAFFSQDAGNNLAEYSNVYVGHFAALCPDFHSQRGGLDDGRLLELAQQGLSQFDVVGLLEDLEDFSAITAQAAGVSCHVAPPRLRVTQNRIPLERLDPEVLALLRKLNALDLELAAFATKAFHRTRTQTLIRFLSTSCAAPVSAPNTRASAPTDGRMDQLQTGSREVEILSIVARGSLSTEANLLTGEELCITIQLLAHVPADDLTVGIHISDPSGIRVFGTNSRLLGMKFSIATPGQVVVSFAMRCELGRGEYLVGAAVHQGLSHLETCYHWIGSGTSFNVLGALGSYFEGKTRLYATVRMMSGDDDPASYETSENGITYPRTVMLQSQPLEEFKAAYSTEHLDYRPNPGEIFNLHCSVTNLGEQTWPIAGTRPVSVCYHWLNADRTVAVYDGIRTRLISEISSGQTLSVLMQIQAPYQAGDYILQITAVQDGVGWFDDKGCPPIEIPIAVTR